MTSLSFAGVRRILHCVILALLGLIASQELHAQETTDIERDEAIRFAAAEFRALALTRGSESTRQLLVAEEVLVEPAATLGVRLFSVRDAGRPHAGAYLVGRYGHEFFRLAGFNAPSLLSLDSRLPRVSSAREAQARAVLYARLLTARGESCVVFLAALANSSDCPGRLSGAFRERAEAAGTFASSQADTVLFTDGDISVRLRTLVAHQTYGGQHRIEPVVYGFIFRRDGLAGWHASIGEAWRSEATAK